MSASPPLTMAQHLARFYARRELPGWGRVLRGAGVYNDAAWKGAGTFESCGKWDRCRVSLDLSNWSERQTYFLGRFYDLPMQLLLRGFVRPGDCVVDVGANVGMISILAARLVGPSGRVVSFEPNPTAFRKLSSALRTNSLSWVSPRPCALADQHGELMLSVVTEHTGMGTLAPVPPADAGLVSATHLVRVCVGDEVLEAEAARPSLIKIDVEGFELAVLKGLARTLVRHHPIVAAEIVQVHLRRAGTSAEAVFDLMRGLGYEAFGLATRRRPVRHRLHLPAITKPSADFNNVVWIHRDDERLAVATGFA
ncbi:MAG: FkbM family methyltransferase [Phycisphaerales bacterium]|nr:FkbM family methyltransferase [Phycisphaerales bacterium]